MGEVLLRVREKGVDDDVEQVSQEPHHVASNVPSRIGFAAAAAPP